MLYFFIGIAGSGMSAIAQYLKGKGHDVCGSDRIFSKPEGQDTKQKLEKLGIACHIQGETLPSPQTDFVVISTAIPIWYKWKIYNYSNDLLHFRKKWNVAVVDFWSRTF